MFTAIKKEILPSVTRMDSEGIMLSEVSQRQILYGFTHMWNLKQKKKKSNKQNKTKTNSQIEQNSGYQWERWFRGKTGEGGQQYGVCVCTRARAYSVISNSLRSQGMQPARLHWIFQARIPEQVAISHSRVPSWPRDGTHISRISNTGRQILYHWIT